ncbi:ribosomal protein S16 [Pycnococcus provasolii]
MASSMSSSLCFRRSSFGAGHVRLAPSSSSASVRPSAAPPRHVTTENNVRIRFARHGRKFSPFYRVVVIDSRARREGRPIQYLGWYNPMKKQTSLNAPAIKEWISKGAQPSESVARLLAKASIIELGEFGTYAG